MNQRLHAFIYEDKYSGLILAVGLLLLLTIWYASFGIFSMHTTVGFDSRLQLVGQVLLLILLPSYLAAALIFAQRRSLQLAQQIQSVAVFNFAHYIELVPRRTLLIGCLVGGFFSLLNLPGDPGFIIRSNSSVVYVIAVGQILLWVFVGFLLAIRFHVARTFYKAGKRVKLDIFEPSGLKPFGQEGLTDALLVVGALTITVVQSIDAQFRLGNYMNAFLVTLPATTVLMVMPMYSLHRRIVDCKNEELRQINASILAAPKDLAGNHVDQLESLLQR
jgi:hypothetical protein